MIIRRITGSKAKLRGMDLALSVLGGTFEVEEDI